MENLIHPLFEVLAVIMAWLTSGWFRKKHQIQHQLIHNEEQYYWYLLVAIVGLFLGAFLFGTLNLWLSGLEGIAKSFLGGIFGAILLVEIYKKLIGYKSSTGLYFIPGLCVLIIIGRLGCFFSGLDDFTYGVATQFIFGYDFGDGVYRHPVQLYESMSLLIFFIYFLVVFPKQKQFWLQKGFYLFILFYAGQRFCWEFLKPYETVFSSFNVFHVLTLLLILWASYQLLSKNHDS